MRLCHQVMCLFALLGVGLVANRAQGSSTEGEELTPQEKIDLMWSTHQQMAGKGAMRTFWKDSLRFETLDGQAKVRLGGRIHLDGAFVGDVDKELERNSFGAPATAPESPFGATEDNIFFRRARLYFEAEVNENVFAKAQFDFAGGSVAWKDVYLALRKVPGIGEFKIGQFKEPIMLEILTSSNDITFIERSLPSNLLPERLTGAAISDQFMSDRMRYEFGVFKTGTGDDGDAPGNHDLAGTVRVSGLPYEDEGGTRLVHLGASASLRAPEDSMVRYRARPEARPHGQFRRGPMAGDSLSIRFIDTGNINNVDSETIFNLEAAAVVDSLSFQAEYLHANLDIDGRSDASFHGWYAFLSWLVTGENRRYKHDAGVFGNPRPKTVFGPGESEEGCWGLGAVELAARVSSLDLTDGAIRGGEQLNYTGGANVYLNNNARIMFNYVLADVEGSGAREDGRAHFFLTRLQFMF